MTENVFQLDPANRTLIIGDSIVAGEGADEDFGWAQHIASMIETDIVGVCGATSADIQHHLPDKNYDRILVQIGTNDARYAHAQDRTETTPAQYAANLGKIVDHFKRFDTDVEVMFLDMLFADERRTVMFKPGRSFFTSDLANIADILHQFCRKERHTFLSLKPIGTDPKCLIDGLHANDRCHRDISNLVRSAGLFTAASLALL